MPLTLRARSAAAMLALVATSPLAAQSAQKFAYVNTGEILQAAPGRTEAEAQLQKEATSMKATLEKMNASYLEMVSAYSNTIEVFICPKSQNILVQRNPTATLIQISPCSASQAR